VERKGVDQGCHPFAGDTEGQHPVMVPTVVVYLTPPQPRPQSGTASPKLALERFPISVKNFDIMRVSSNIVGSSNVLYS